MATVSLLGTATFNTTAGSKTVTATPAVGDLIVIITAHTGNTASVAPTDNNSGGAGAYTFITAAQKGTNVDRMEVWIRTGLVSTAASTVFTHNPGTTTGGGLAVFKVTGMTRAGAAAAVQSAVQQNIVSAIPAPVFGATPNSSNPIIGAVFNATSPATITPRTGYTEALDLGYATPTTGLEAMYLSSGETSATITWGGAATGTYSALVLELDTSAAPKMSTFVDAMTATSVSSTLWNTSTGGSATLTAATTGVSMTMPAAATASSFADMTSKLGYDLTSSAVFINVASMFAATTSADATFQVTGSSGANGLVFQVEAGLLYAIKRVANTSTNLTSATYNATTHAWWRIREASGTTFWETSSDGTTWSTFWSVANPLSQLTQFYVDISGSCFQAESNAGTFKFVSLNTAPSSGSTLTKTQSGTARIAITATKTQPATSRIQKSVTKTQTAISRMQKSLTKTQSAIARVQKSLTKTQSATARISVITIATQTATANIATSTPKVATLTDDFNDNTQNTSKWTLLTNNGSVAEQNQRLEITGNSAAWGYSGYRSVNTFDLTSSAIYVRVPQTTNTVAGAETVFRLTLSATNPDDNYIAFVKGNDSFIPRYQVAGVQNDNYPTYNATNHQWWRISHDGTNILWDAAPDNAGAPGTWTNIRSVALSTIGIAITSVYVDLTAGQYQGTTGTGTAYYDNLNITPASGTTITKTQPATARIARTPTATQAALARISLSLTKTQSATSRIQKVSTKTQPANARIQLQASKNQTASARLKLTTTKTQTATGRISLNQTKTQTATATLTANISSFNGNFETYPATNTAGTNTASRWIDGTAAGSTTASNYAWAIPGAGITASAQAQFDTTVSHSGSASMRLDTLDAVGTVVVSSFRTNPPGTSSAWELLVVQPSTQYTLSGWIKTSNVKSLGAYIDVRQFSATLTNLNTTSTPKQSGTVDWTLVTLTFTTASNATYIGLLLRNAIAGNISSAWFDDIAINLSSSSSKTQPATARLQKNLTSTQSALGSIRMTLAKTQTATASIQVQNSGLTKTQTATARIAKLSTKTQPGTARIQVASAKTQTATGRLSLIKAAAQTALARLAMVRSATQTATARLRLTRSLTQTAQARIAKVFSKTQTAAARIASRPAKTQPARARVRTTPLKTQAAIARLAVVRSKSQAAVSRIQTTGTAIQSATARIEKAEIDTSVPIILMNEDAALVMTAEAREVLAFGENDPVTLENENTSVIMQ